MAEAHLTHEQVQQRFQGGPTINNSVVLVVIDHRMYKREGNGWRLLDDRVRATVKELTDGSS